MPRVFRTVPGPMSAALDFVAPVTAGTVGALDGNAIENSSVISFSLAQVLGVGQTIWIRWRDFDATGEDDGLAVDDFEITAMYHPLVPEPSSLVVWTLTGLFGLCAIGRTRCRALDRVRNVYA